MFDNIIKNKLKDIFLIFGYVLENELEK